MAAVTLRGDLNRPLSNAEVDGNFSALNTGKADKAANLSDLASAVDARTNLSVYSKLEADANALTKTIPVTGNVTVTKGALHQVTATAADLLVPLDMSVGEWFQVVNYGLKTGVIVRTNGLLINGVNDDVRLDRLGCVYTFKYISAAKGLTISC